MRDDEKVLPGLVRMHPEKGVNARPSICPRCDQPGKQVMLGTKDYMALCKACEIMSLGHEKGNSKCPACGKENEVELLEIPEEMAIPFICDLCRTDIQTCAKIVKEGGAFWKCEDCGSDGAFTAIHPMTKRARKELGIPTTQPCNIALDKSSGCPVCSVKMVN